MPPDDMTFGVSGPWHGYTQAPRMAHTATHARANDTIRRTGAGDPGRRGLVLNTCSLGWATVGVDVAADARDGGGVL